MAELLHPALPRGLVSGGWERPWRPWHFCPVEPAEVVATRIPQKRTVELAGFCGTSTEPDLQRCP